MNSDYIITNDELMEKGIDLTQYAVDTTYVSPIINQALDLAITRILFLNDNFEYESDIESALDNNSDLVDAFKKLQKQVIYNLLFLGDSDTIDRQVDNIIGGDLKWGKVNAYQKYIR